MKVGIIVHSHTGNTLSVAEKLKEKLLEIGHSVNLERVTAYNEDPSAAGNIQLKTRPDISAYEVVIFAAPVRGFSLSPVMKAYLEQLPTLKGKKVGCFVTQYFPFPSMGGNRSIEQFEELCEAKGCRVFETGIINWSNWRRKTKIIDVVEKLKNI